MNGDLASIPDGMTNAFVANLAPGTAWIGGRLEDFGDPGWAGRWIWSDGSPWQYTSWAEGQPDNSVFIQLFLGNEDYAGINFGMKGKWNNWVNEGHTSWYMPVEGFVCQYRNTS